MMECGAITFDFFFFLNNVIYAQFDGGVTLTDWDLISFNLLRLREDTIQAN